MTVKPTFFTPLVDKPEYSDYVVATPSDVILRLDPETKQLIGFTIIDFSQHFAKQESDITLPFGIDFQMYERVIPNV